MATLSFLDCSRWLRKYVEYCGLSFKDRGRGKGNDEVLFCGRSVVSMYNKWDRVCLYNMKVNAWLIELR